MLQLLCPASSSTRGRNRCRRELAQQVAAEARDLRGVWGLRVAAVYGGADRAQQVIASPLWCQANTALDSKKGSPCHTGTVRRHPRLVFEAAQTKLMCITSGRHCAQIELLAKKPHVLVATPGRLLDLADTGALSLGASTFSSCPL